MRREHLADQAQNRKQMHEIAGNRRRFGCRRINIMPERQGFTRNGKKLYRLYGEVCPCGKGADGSGHAITEAGAETSEYAVVAGFHV